MKWVVCGRSPTYPLHSIAIHPCPRQRPVASAHGHPAGQGKKQEADKDGNWPASARPKRFRRCPPALPRLTPRLFARSAHFKTSRGVRRAARARPKARRVLLLARSIPAHRTFKQGSNDFQSSSISFSNDLQTASNGCSKSLNQDNKVFTKGAIDYASY